ncbi:MAG: oxygenase MpaB family protein [Xanthomarina sp.]
MQVNKEKQITEKFNFFWNEGIGKKFKDWANVEPSLTKFDCYDSLFKKYDALGDQIVSATLKDETFSKIMQSLSENDHQSLPRNVKALLAKMEHTPEWVNQNLLKAGAQLSQRSGLIGLVVLRNFSLLGGYYFSSLTKPLVFTGALEKGAKQRLFYTLSFWIDVNSLDTDANKIRLNACLKTRLIHSASRLMILKNTAKWHPDVSGIPINIMDMVATSIGFTLYFLHGLKKLNFKFTEEEELGVFQLWKYITWLLGVPEELIPNNKQEAVAFFYYWTSKQGLPNKDSIKLANALLKENTALNLLKFDFLKENIAYIHGSVANYLLDKQIKTDLHLPETRFKNLIIGIVKTGNIIVSKSSKMKQIQKGNADQQSVLNDYK